MYFHCKSVMLSLIIIPDIETTMIKLIDYFSSQILIDMRTCTEIMHTKHNKMINRLVAITYTTHNTLCEHNMRVA